LSFSSGLSAAKREIVLPRRRTQERINGFITEIVRDVSTSLDITMLL
jgi:hypothetical protein